MRSFQINRDAVADLKQPDIDPYADVKSRITALESIVLFQGEVNPLTVALSDDLNIDLYKIEAKILRLIVLNQQKVAKEIDEMKSHYDHRYLNPCPL